MRTSVHMKLLIAAAVAVFVVSSIWVYLQTRIVLWPTMDASGAARPVPENIWLLRLWTYLGRAVFSLAFVWMFTRGYEGKGGIGEGIRFGVAVGALMLIPAFFAGLTGERPPSISYLATRCLLDFVGLVLVGILANIIYRPQRVPRAT